jgi:plasmid stabilization system protein ParE
MRIRWTDPAVRDFTQICDYISEHGSAATARQLTLSIYGQICILAKFLEVGAQDGSQKHGNSCSLGGRT